MIWTSLIAQGKRRLWMSLFVALLVTLIYFHFARFYQGSTASWLFALGWIPVLLNLLRAVLGLVYRLDRHPFRLLDLGIASDQVPPGQPFDVEIRVQSRRASVLRALRVELRCTRIEVAERGRKSEVLERFEEVVEQGLEMPVGFETSFHVSLPVPAEAPFSYRSMERKIQWALFVDVSVDEWGELQEELEVAVAPG